MKRRRIAWLLSLMAVIFVVACDGAEEAVGGPVVEDMALGQDDAPVTIIEFASLTCPHCAEFHRDIFPRIKDDYIESGKVRLVYRDYPIGPLAYTAAMMARCGGKERFFGFLEVLYRTQQSWVTAKDPVGALAKVGRLGGMSRKTLDACLNDQELLEVIIRGRLDGENTFEVSSTPTLIINDKKYVGLKSYDEIRAILDELLSKT